MGSDSKYRDFSDVDGSKDPRHLVHCLNEQFSKDTVMHGNKQRTLELADLQDGLTVLDAGCGIGLDAIQMARKVGRTGHVFGIDNSREMIATARSNAAGLELPLTFLTGSLYQLEFQADFFDRCRSDKTFQHLSDPQAALRELIRVTKPGGKIIIADPDHDSVIIDTPFAELNQRFVRFRSGHMPQGGIAHQLYGICRDLGLLDVHVEPLTHVYTDYEERKITAPYLDEIWIARENGAVTREEAEAWSGWLQKAIEDNRFMCMQTYVITTAVKPVPIES